jgi:hypothetical protein
MLQLSLRCKIKRNQAEEGFGPKVSTPPIMAIGCWQCLPLSVVQLKGKHCRKSHCRDGVVDMFGHSLISYAILQIFENLSIIDHISTYVLVCHLIQSAYFDYNAKIICSGNEKNCTDNSQNDRIN